MATKSSASFFGFHFSISRAAIGVPPEVEA